MQQPRTKRGWSDHIASLKRKAMAGDLRAMTDLGLTLRDGIRDRTGRSRVRRNLKAAVAWLREAANLGDTCAAGSLGYAYDVGSGVPRNTALAIHWYRRAAKSGSSVAASNLATVYRDVGKARLAFRWWARSADMGDDDAAVDVGYGYQYGIGVRRNPHRAKLMYEHAIASRSISQHDREAAMYHLALQCMDQGDRRSALSLLMRANSDGDYPEAAAVLRQILAGSDFTPCRCKRVANKRLLGHAECRLHPR